MRVAPFLSISFGLVGWYPLVLSAALAQGDTAGVGSIATALALAGAASVVSVTAAIIGLANMKRSSRSAGVLATISAVGLVSGAAVGLIAIVFALSFHW